MKITSSAFENGQPIPAKYTCDGKNFSPPLQISEIPPKAQCLVIIVDDPDAPGKTWVHWTAWNINPKTIEIKEGEVPEGSTQGLTDFGEVGYSGPCPPGGTHRYYFKVYAISEKLNLPYQTTKVDLEKTIENLIIEKSVLIGSYSRVQ